MKHCTNEACSLLRHFVRSIYIQKGTIDIRANGLSTVLVICSVGNGCVRKEILGHS
jgi:hypothetical protein